MCRSLRLLLIVLFGMMPVFLPPAKAANIDSLRNALLHAGDDSARCRINRRLCLAYESTNQDSALFFIKKADSIADRLQWKMGQLLCCTEYAYLLMERGRFSEGLDLCRKGEVLSKSLNDSNGLRSTYINFGLAFTQSNRFDSAAFYYMRATSIAQATGDSMAMAVILGNLGGVYQRMHQPQRGYDAAMQSVRLCRALRNDANMPNALNGVAACLLDLQRYDEAERLLQEGVDVCTRSNNSGDLAIMLLNLDNVYKYTGRYALIPPTAGKAIKLATDVGSPMLWCVAMQDFAFYHFTQHAYDSATGCARRSMDSARAGNYLVGLEDPYQLLAAIALTRGNLAGYLRYNLSRDSVRSEEFTQQMLTTAQDMEAKYQTASKESRIVLQAAELRRSRSLMWLLAGSLIAAVVIIALSLRAYQVKQRLATREQQLAEGRISQLQKEQQLAATEAVLQAQDDERTRMAKDLHDGLGGMLSGIKFSFSNMKDNMIMAPEQQAAFSRSLDMLDASIGELRRVAHNMMPESLIRFGLDAALRDLCQYVNSSGTLRVACQLSGLTATEPDKGISINVYRIVQELLNNIIRHAGATEAVVQVTRSGENWSVTVEDDGKGFEETKVKAGMGLTSVRNRVTYLNGVMDIRSSPAQGSSILIEFKNASA